MVTYFNLKVELNGEEPFSTISGFTLVQRYDTHHSFELRVPLESVESDGNQAMNKSKSFIGESIKFKISGVTGDNNQGAVQSEFNGVVTSIAIARQGGIAGDLLVRGFSPTIILDHGLNTKVFAQTTLSGLVSTITGKYPSNGMRFKVNPRPNPQLAFVHQHQESTYNFLRRLANRYGQWFLYDGKDCVFGKLSGGETVAMKFGSDLTAFELGVSLAPTKFKTMAVDGGGKSMQAPSLPVEHLDQLGSFAFDQSNKYFFEEQTFNTEQSVTTANDVQDIGKNRRAAIAAELVKFLGASTNGKLKIGGNISISADSPSGSNTDYGTFTVIAIKHTLDGRGDYRNSFEAVPSAIDVPPASGEEAYMPLNAAVTDGFSLD